MIVVVLDTNVFVSGFLNPQGTPATILDRVLDINLLLLLSPQIIEEIKRVFAYKKIVQLLEKADKTTMDAIEFVEDICKIAFITLGTYQVETIKDDPSDNMFLSCALEGRADYIISGDSHLLALEDFQGIHIVSPNEFLMVFPEQD